MAFLRKGECFRSTPDGVLMARAKWLLIHSSLGSAKKYLSTKLVRHSPCRVKSTWRDPTWELSCVSVDICVIYPLLQCQSSSGSVGKSIWLAFRRPKFKSWQDLKVFFHQNDVLWWLMMSQDVSWCLKMSHGGSWCHMVAHDVSKCLVVSHETLGGSPCHHCLGYIIMT